MGHDILIQCLLSSNLPFALFSTQSVLYLYFHFVFGIFIFTSKLKVPKLIGHIKSQAYSDHAVNCDVAYFSKYFSGIIFYTIVLGSKASYAHIFHYLPYLPHLEIYSAFALVFFFFLNSHICL